MLIRKRMPSYFMDPFTRETIPAGTFTFTGGVWKEGWDNGVFNALNKATLDLAVTNCPTLKRPVILVGFSESLKDEFYVIATATSFWLDELNDCELKDC